MHVQNLQSLILEKDQQLSDLKERIDQLEATQGASTGALSELLAKERDHVQVVASELQDAQRALRDEQAKRKIAEDKLAAVIAQRQQAAATEAELEGLLGLANEELGKKEISLREAKRKSDIIDGVALEKRSRQELIQAQKQLNDVLKAIGQILLQKNE